MMSQNHIQESCFSSCLCGKFSFVSGSSYGKHKQRQRSNESPLWVQSMAFLSVRSSTLRHHTMFLGLPRCLVVKKPSAQAGGLPAILGTRLAMLSCWTLAVTARNCSGVGQSSRDAKEVGVWKDLQTWLQQHLLHEDFPSLLTPPSRNNSPPPSCQPHSGHTSGLAPNIVKRYHNHLLTSVSL